MSGKVALDKNGIEAAVDFLHASSKYSCVYVCVVRACVHVCGFLPYQMYGVLCVCLCLYSWYDPTLQASSSG